MEGRKKVRSGCARVGAGTVLAAAVAGALAPAAGAETTLVQMPSSHLGTGIGTAGIVTRNYYADPASPSAMGVTLPGPAGQSATGPAQVVGMPDLPGGSPRPAGASADLLSPAPLTVHGLGGFSIVINPDAGLAANPAALSAFNRAAQQWAAHISDPIVVTVNAGLAPLGAGIIGSTGSLTLFDGYTSARNRLVADAAGNPNKAIVAAMPTAAQYFSYIPAGKSLDGNAYLTKANAKAMGYTGLDAAFGASDGTITFSSNFNFDFDNGNGVGAGLMDFESVAAHELGHLLGFVSNVDDFDATSVTATGPTVLDFFRFRNLAGSKPTDAASFTTTIRALVPNDDQVTSDTVTERRMSTGRVLGDGRQASHWKADELTGSFIGVMDPTLSFGDIELVGGADLRAMELIGYEIAVPEPGTAGLLLSAALPALARRRRGACRA